MRSKAHSRFQDACPDDWLSCFQPPDFATEMAAFAF